MESVSHLAAPADASSQPQSPIFRLIAIGGSAGSFEEIQTILAGVPSDFPGAICIVIHTSPQSQSLANNLARSAAVPVIYAEDDMPILAGHVYVAPPDYHMLVNETRFSVVRGPRENHCRPAIDPLFRSVALSFGNRARAVVLSGYLDDGASGAIAVSRCGGRVAVQSPASASASDMPNNTLAAVDVDFVGNPVQLTRWLVGTFEDAAREAERYESQLDESQQNGDADNRTGDLGDASQPNSKDDNRDQNIINDHIQREVHISQSIESNIPLEESIGELVPMTCPECNGPLWEVHIDRVRRYRCHTGHAYTAKALVAHQDEAIESALWAAMRLMQERANSLSQLSRDGTVGGSVFERRAEESRNNANILRQLLVGSCKASDMGERSSQLKQEHA